MSDEPQAESEEAESLSSARARVVVDLPADARLFIDDQPMRDLQDVSIASANGAKAGRPRRFSREIEARSMASLRPCLSQGDPAILQPSWPSTFRTSSLPLR